MKVTVAYFVTLDTDNLEDFEEGSVEEKKNQILDLADKCLESSPPSPVIHDCEDTDLID